MQNVDDVQTKAIAQVRLEKDMREDDDKYYRPSRKIWRLRLGIISPIQGR